MSAIIINKCGWLFANPAANTTMYFSKSMILGVIGLLLLFALGLLIYVYGRGGVDSAIYLRGPS